MLIHIFHKNHLQVPNSYLSSNGFSSPPISLWHRNNNIRLPASFSSVIETTRSILSSLSLSVKRSGWGVPLVSKWARTEIGVERIFMGVFSLCYVVILGKRKNQMEASLFLGKSPFGFMHERIQHFPNDSRRF